MRTSQIKKVRKNVSDRKSRSVWIVLLIIVLISVMIFLFRPEFLQIKMGANYIEEYNLKTALSKSGASEEMLKKVLVNPDFCEKKGYDIDKWLLSESLDSESFKPFIMHEYKFLGRYHPTIYCIEEIRR